jgi:hypothetical protein
MLLKLVSLSLVKVLLSMPRMVCVGTVLEDVMYSISGQARQGRKLKHKACGIAQVLGMLWKKLLEIMLSAITIAPDTEALPVRVRVRAPRFKLKVKSLLVCWPRICPLEGLRQMGPQKHLLATLLVEISIVNQVPGTSDLAVLMGECTPVICTKLESKSFVESALFPLVNDAWCNEPTIVVGMWKCASMCAVCVGTPHQLCDPSVDPKEVKSDGDLLLCEFALRADVYKARLSSINQVTAKFYAVGLVLYPVAVEASRSFISEEESSQDPYAQDVFVWRQQNYCSTVLIKLCRHCIYDEWWMANATSQQGNSWYVVSCPKQCIGRCTSKFDDAWPGCLDSSVLVEFRCNRTCVLQRFEQCY